MSSDITHDLVLTYRESAQNKFDQVHGEDLAALVGDVSQVHSILLMDVLEGDPMSKDRRFHGFALLNRCLDSLVSAIQLVRQGATEDAFSLLRIVLETAAVAVHINLDPDAFSSYRGLSGRKYDSGRAIGSVREKIPRLPEFWGALSQAAVHTNVRTFGPRVNSDGSESITMGNREPDPLRDRGGLYGVSCATAFVLRAAELVLLEEYSACPGWLRLPNSNSIVTALGESLVEKRYERFASLPAAEAANRNGNLRNE